MRLKSNTFRLAKCAFAESSPAQPWLAGSVAAQCTLVSPPLSFEPSPPGAARPWNLYGGHNSDLGSTRAAGFAAPRDDRDSGYSVLDWRNPASPTALLYNDTRFNDGIPAVGDGQSYVGSIGVSSDGARLALSLTNPAQPEYGSVAATANGIGFNRMTGGFMPRSGATAVQGVGGRYLAYSLTFMSGALTVADITNLPGALAPTNVSSERVVGAGGIYLTIAGNNVLYLDHGSNTIRIYDASNPGPVGNIGRNFGLTTLSSADFWGRVPTSFSAATDPADPTRLWVLVELSSPLSYALVSVKGGVKTVNPQAFTDPAAER